jgi:hypothetical protein
MADDYQGLNMSVTMQDLAECIKRQMVEIDRQRSVIARQQMEIDHLVAWASSDLDALMTLQAIYRNPNTPEGNRIKAALGAIDRELPKLPRVVAVAPFNLFNHLESNKVVDLEARRAKVIEQAPTPPDAA